MNKSLNYKKKAIDIIEEVLREVELVYPTKESMIADLKMMSFKVRPISGDIFHLIRKDEGFLGALWRIGKTEEILSVNINKLDDTEKEKLFIYLQDLEIQRQGLIKENIERLSKRDKKKIEMVKLEVFKDRDPSRSSLPN